MQDAAAKERAWEAASIPMGGGAAVLTPVLARDATRALRKCLTPVVSRAADLLASPLRHLATAASPAPPRRAAPPPGAAPDVAESLSSAGEETAPAPAPGSNVGLSLIHI